MLENGSPIHTLLVIRHSIFNRLPVDLIREINRFVHNDPVFKTALDLAKSATTEDLEKLIKMIKVKPTLLLQRGNVITRGGVEVNYNTLYEFFLLEGDPKAAERIASLFGQLPNGENERQRQYERCRPYIEKMAKQIESKQPAYDLRPLFNIIKESPMEDILEALKINDPEIKVIRNTTLRKEFAKFRKAVTPKGKTIGMHYEHYTTLFQGLELLAAEWKNLRNNLSNRITDYDKCRLVWRQIIGYLQRSLPAIDRFAFARAFEDSEREVQYNYDPSDSFPDAGDCDPAGLGFGQAIFGFRSATAAGAAADAARFYTACRAKISNLQSLSSEAQSINRLDA